jgi:chemotaxis protein CheD
VNEEPLIIRVRIGQLAVERRPVILKATLGSCVGVAMLWHDRGIYGLAHCLLPAAPRPDPGPGARYVDQAVASLLRLFDAQPEDHRRIEAHLAGGGDMMARTRSAERGPHIGRMNIEAARRCLAERGIEIASADVGGCHARQMVLDCAAASVSVMCLPSPVQGGAPL